MNPTTISTERQLDAPAGEVWAVLADDFGRPHQWAAGIRAARLIGNQQRGPGTSRRCELGRGKFIVEEVQQWSDGRSLTYAVTDTNMPVKSGEVTWSVIPLSGGRSTVRVETTYQLKHGVVGALMNHLVARRSFLRQFEETLLGLERHVQAEMSA